jgi:hypothetical protein
MRSSNHSSSRLQQQRPSLCRNLAQADTMPGTERSRVLMAYAAVTAAGSGYCYSSRDVPCAAIPPELTPCPAMR